MTATRINVSNTDKVEAHLKTAQKGCSTRLLTADDITEALATVEASLAGLPKGEWAGIVAYIGEGTGSSEFANSYKGTPMLTTVTVERGSAAWFVTGARREPVGRSGAIEEVDLSEAQFERWVRGQRDAARIAVRREAATAA